MTRPELPLFALAALAIIATTILAVTGHAIPDTLNLVTAAAVGGGAAAISPTKG